MRHLRFEENARVARNVQRIVHSGRLLNQVPEIPLLSLTAINCERNNSTSRRALLLRSERKIKKMHCRRNAIILTIDRCIVGQWPHNCNQCLQKLYV